MASVLKTSKLIINTLEDFFKILVKASSSLNDPVFTGIGLDDLSNSGVYVGSEILDIQIIIDGAGTPDTFKWSKDGGGNFVAVNVPITGAAQLLDFGISITFGATTGHILNDQWDFQTPVENPLKIVDADDNLIMYIGNNGWMGLGKIPEALIDAKAAATGADTIRVSNTLENKVVTLGTIANDHGGVRIFEGDGITEIVRLSATGEDNFVISKLGINTQTPATQLDIKAQAAGADTARVSNTAGDRIVTFGTLSGDHGGIRIFNASGDEIVRLSATGSFSWVDSKLAVNTVTPNSTLHVQGSVSKPVIIRANSYTAIEADHTILALVSTNDMVITLPTAVNILGREYVIKRTGATDKIVTVDGAGIETIDGNLTYILHDLNESITLISDGANWIIRSKNKKVYGSIFETDPTGSTVITLTSADTYVGWVTAGASVMSNGVAFTNNTTADRITIQIGAAGDYEIDFTASFGGSVSERITIAVFKNGVEQTNIKAFRKLNAAGDVGNVAANDILTLAEDDFIDVRFKAVNASKQVNIFQCNLRVKKVD